VCDIVGVRKAVIPAAGLGRRFLPATKAQAKEMLPIVDKPTIQYIVEETVASGIEDIIIVTGRNKEAIEHHFDKSFELEEVLRDKSRGELLNEIKRIARMANIQYVRQGEPLGLGHAVYCAKSFIGAEPFAVLLGDDIIAGEEPCLKQLIDIFNHYQSTVLGVQRVAGSQVSKYGIVDGNAIKERVFRVMDVIEKLNSTEAP
jgi:UTP--glucose-1-phosphate uridylyltransferase